MAGIISNPRPNRSSNGKPLRGVAVYDIELEGGVAVAAKFEEVLQEYIDGFEDYLKEKNPRLLDVVHFSQKKAAVPLQERRGATGALDQIVFRGTRGDYTKVEVAEVFVEKVDRSKEVILVRRADKPNDDKWYYEFPLGKLTARMRDSILAAWALGDEKPRTLSIKVDTFEKFATKI